MDKPALNVALLIDADNASAGSIDPVLTVLAELGTVNIRRAYGNWSKAALKGWEGKLIRYGIEAQHQFDLTKGKNATDMKMTIDAMDLLSRGRVGGFGIMSSDSDFAPLATRIRQEGIAVYGFGTARTPEGFRSACTRFIDVGALIGEAAAEEAPPKPVRGRAKATLDKAKPAPATAGKTPAKQADAPAGASTSAFESSLPPAIGGGSGARVKKQVSEDLLKLLIDAYDSVKRDAKGYASLSAVGKIAGNRSSFDTRNYGYPRLSDLIADVPNFQTEQRGDEIYVKRLR